MKKLFRFIVVSGILAFLFYCGVVTIDPSKWESAKDLLNEGKETVSQMIADTKYNGPYEVEKVVDGDTIVIALGVDSVKVRLIGVDTPESVSSDVTENCPEGFEASEFMKNLLAGKSVYLEYDEDMKDPYDRTLAYVYIKENGKHVMVNRILLEEGMACTMTIEPNTKYADEFKAIEKNAKLKKIGFWDGYVFD